MPPAPREGYAHPAFARSHAEHGDVIELPESGASVLLLPIEGTASHEAVGPYPLLSCDRPDRLGDDLGVLRDAGAITFTAVLDPLHGAAPVDPRFVMDRSFKTHHLTVPSDPAPTPTPHHLREVRRASRSVTVIEEPGHLADVDEWMRLWTPHVEHHGLTGMAAGSRATFVEQLRIPGTVMMWGAVEGRRVAAQIVLSARSALFAHLAVSDPIGRRARAMYAIDAALHAWGSASGRIVHWGGTAGTEDAEDGLAAYKRGWANATCAARLVGAVLDERAYRTLGGTTSPAPADWFPVYRALPKRRAGG